MAALHKRKARRAKPQLKTEQEAHLPESVTRGAQANGFRGDLWTRGRGADVIWRDFGVRYTQIHLGCILHACGPSSYKSAAHDNETKNRFACLVILIPTQAPDRA